MTEYTPNASLVQQYLSADIAHAVTEVAKWKAIVIELEQTIEDLQQQVESLSPEPEQPAESTPITEEEETLEGEVVDND